MMNLSEYEGRGLKVEDLLPGPAEELRKETRERDRRSIEQTTLEEQIARLGKTLNPQSNLAAWGIRLALEMAVEIRDNIPLGQRSGLLAAEWATQRTEAEIAEIVQYARALLLRPADLTAALRERLFDGRA